MDLKNVDVFLVADYNCGRDYSALCYIRDNASEKPLNSADLSKPS